MHDVREYTEQSLTHSLKGYAISSELARVQDQMEIYKKEVKRVIFKLIPFRPMSTLLRGHLIWKTVSIKNLWRFLMLFGK